MNAIECATPGRYRWLKAYRIIALCVLAGCSLVRAPRPVDSPSEAARHKAALATVVVANATTSELTIAFHSATPPVQEIVIGTVLPGEQAHMAPVPAGEPIVLIARLKNGGELQLQARSFPLDAEWTWQIPADAKFTKPGQ